MDKPEAFMIKLVGTKFEIAPYFTDHGSGPLRYRIVLRRLAPPTTADFIANPRDLQALRDWLDHALAHHPSGKEAYQDD